MLGDNAVPIRAGNRDPCDKDCGQTTRNVEGLLPPEHPGSVLSWGMESHEPIQASQDYWPLLWFVIFSLAQDTVSLVFKGVGSTFLHLWEGLWDLKAVAVGTLFLAIPKPVG